MKQQKLFNSMWFLAVAVFVALPAKAQVVQDAVQPKSYNWDLIAKIPRISEIALPATTIKEWLSQSPTPDSQSQYPIQITPKNAGWGIPFKLGEIFWGRLLAVAECCGKLDKVGWRYSLLAVSVVMLLGLVPVLFYKERGAKSKSTNIFMSYIKPFVSFLSRPKMLPWLFIVLLYMAGHNMAGTMIRPLLVDRGLSLSDIGWLLGVASYSVGIVSALIAGVTSVRIGRRRSLKNMIAPSLRS